MSKIGKPIVYTDSKGQEWPGQLGPCTSSEKNTYNLVYFRISSSNGPVCSYGFSVAESNRKMPDTWRLA